jgi:hypothetical protein
VSTPRVEDRIARQRMPADTRPLASRGDTPWWAPLVALAVFFGVMWLIPALMS